MCVRKIIGETGLLAFFTTAVFLAGCGGLQRTYEAAFEPRPVIIQPEYNEKKFASSQTQDSTVVENAVKLSEKYARLSDELTRSQLKNQTLQNETVRLKNRLAELEDNLARSQKELSEANQFLLDMRVELESWKHNVLGFRDEMRTAQRVQLEKLAQILQFLGAEAGAESAENKTEPQSNE